MLKAGKALQDRRVPCARVGSAAVLGLGVLALTCVPVAGSQSGAGNPFGFPDHVDHTFPHTAVSTGSSMDLVTTERQRITVNAERQKQIVTDSEKLLKLTKELNDEVAAGNTGEWSFDEMEKIAKIEKLARNVKARMLDTADQPAAALPASSPAVYSPR
jgi:hypothetical protein